jgi:hypothetical protein
LSVLDFPIGFLRCLFTRLEVSNFNLVSSFITLPLTYEPEIPFLVTCMCVEIESYKRSS